MHRRHTRVGYSGDMRCALLALLALLAGAASIQVDVRDSEVWLIRDGQATQLTHDGKAKLQAVLSPALDRIAYYEECPQAERCLPSVVVMDLAGRRLSVFQPKSEWGGGCGSILSIAWRGTDVIAAECHINPSLNEYVETDISTGATRRDLVGYWFTPSPDGKRVAHVGWVPHFAPPFAQSNYLQVENTTIYPLPKGSAGGAEGPAVSAPGCRTPRRGFFGHSRIHARLCVGSRFRAHRPGGLHLRLDGCHGSGVVGG